MTHTEVKQRQSALFPGPRIEPGDGYHGPDATLPEICLDLRQALNGAADPWPDDTVKATLQLLRDVVATWQPPRSPHDGEMDTCVYRLVKATIAYAGAHVD